MEPLSTERCGSALVDFPVAFGVESHLKEAVFGVVAFAAAGTDHVAAPCSPFAVIIFGDRECGATTAGDEEHAEGSSRRSVGGRVALSGRSLPPRRRTLWSG